MHTKKFAEVFVRSLALRSRRVARSCAETVDDDAVHLGRDAHCFYPRCVSQCVDAWKAMYVKKS